MKNKSIWTDVSRKDICPRLDKDIDVDVLIVGGGITGMSTAYHLCDSNLKVCLVEANHIGMGVTSKTTGKLTYLQENIYSKLKNFHSIDKVKLYLESQIDAMKLVEEIVSSNKIDCNFEQATSYVFSNSQVEKLDEEINLLKELGVSVRVTNVLPNGENVNKTYCVEDTYVFHPIKYLYALKDICLKKKVGIYENTKVTAIDRKENVFVCRTNGNIIRAKYVVMAVHYPYFLIPFMMPLKTYLEKSYIEAFKVEKNYRFSAINISKPVVSIRFHTEGYNNYQIYLTNSHNYCVKNNEKKNFNNLLRNKNVDPDYLWSNKDIITNDLLPFIGNISNNLLIGTGYNTWGMTNGSLAGKILSDVVLGKKNKYVELFDPHREFNLGKLVSFPIVVWSSAYSMIKNKIKKQKDWYSDQVRFEKRNGKSVGVYMDDEGKEHIVYNLCPHMKCSLIFNEIEKTWDCPCHGSRFDVDGKVIEGPSNYNITFSEK